MSTQVGSASVAIFPIFKGFRKATDKAVQDATASGARTFSQGFNAAAAATGASSGKAFSQGFSQSFTTTAPKTLAGLQSAVAASSRTLSTARLAEADALGKVNVAQANYAAAQKRYAADSPQVVRTFENLAAAQRRYSAAQGVTVASTARLQASQSALANGLTEVAKKPSAVGAAFSSMGASIQGGFGDLMKGAVGLVTSGVTAIIGAAAVGGAAITAALSTVATMGFNRLATIETAQAKLKGLGQTSETIAEIMKNANEAVIGTQYSLADAVTAAASAVAAGIKPGQDLTKYLKLNANAAASAGVQFSDLSLVMNQVTSQGKAYTQDLNQVASRGIPIYQRLGEVYGETIDEIRKRLSDPSLGVDAEHFRQALTIAVGSSADEIGKTTIGSFENMKAAISRLGAALISPVFPLAAKAFTGVTKALDDLKLGLQPIADKYGPGIAAAIQDITNRAAPFVTGFVQKIIDWANSPAGAKFFSDMSDALGDVGDTVIKALPSVISFTTESLKLAGALTLLATKAAPSWIHGAAQIADAMATISSNFATATNDISNGTFWDVLGQKFANGGKQIGDFFATWAQNVGPGGGFANGWNQLIAFSSQAQANFNVGFQGWINGLGVSFGNGWDQLTAKFGNGWAQWQAAADNGWSQLMGKFQNGANQIGGAFGNGWAQWQGIAANGWNQLVAKFTVGWLQLTGGARASVAGIVSTFSGLYTQITGFFNGVGTWLYESGKKLIGGFVQGIKDMIGAAVNAAKSVVTSVANFFPNSPAKKGPFSGKGWTPYRGRALVEGFAVGMVAASPTAADAGRYAVTSVANSLSGIVPSQVGGSSASASSAAATGARTAPLIGTVVAPDQNPEVSGRIIGEEVDRILKGL